MSPTNSSTSPSGGGGSVPHPAIKTLDSIIEADSDEGSQEAKSPAEGNARSSAAPSSSVGALRLEMLPPAPEGEGGAPQRLESFTSTPRSSCSAISLRGVRSAPLLPQTPYTSLATGIAGPLEDPVQSTTDDASVSKLSAVEAGYYEDPYLQHIVRRRTKRSPLINRGYFVRVAALRKAMSIFLNSASSAYPTVQIVNVGAGLDTTYFWIHDFWETPVVRFFEVDFLEVITKKLLLLTKKPPLWQCLNRMTGCRAAEEIETDWKKGGIVRVTETLAMIPVDFRQCDRLEELLLASGFDPHVPTLFISECALVYVQASQSDPVIAWAASTMRAPSAFVMYEQVNPHDAFGRTMVNNLELRGCPLLSIHDYPTVDSQKARFLRLGWDRVTAADMNQIYDNYMDKYEILRIQGLELFDEIEEWRLIQAHYFVLVALTSGQAAQPKDQRVLVEDTFLKDLAVIWESNSTIHEELPRFSTQELREHVVGRSPLFVPSSRLPSMGTLSPLLRPEATNVLLHDFPDLAASSAEKGGVDVVSRKWSLSLDGGGGQ